MINNSTKLTSVLRRIIIPFLITKGVITFNNVKDVTGKLLPVIGIVLLLTVAYMDARGYFKKQQNVN
jgi:hypothetical protein